MWETITIWGISLFFILYVLNVSFSVNLFFFSNIFKSLVIDGVFFFIIILQQREVLFLVGK